MRTVHCRQKEEGAGRTDRYDDLGAGAFGKSVDGVGKGIDPLKAGRRRIDKVCTRQAEGAVGRHCVNCDGDWVTVEKVISKGRKRMGIRTTKTPPPPVMIAT